jgi:hypothetical protein
MLNNCYEVPFSDRDDAPYSFLKDARDMVLVLQDDGAPFKITPVWTLDGFQPKPSNSSDPMGRASWEAEGANPRDYEFDQVSPPGLTAPHVMEWSEFDSEKLVRHYIKVIEDANQFITERFQTLQFLQQCHSIEVITQPTITHLSQVILSGWRHIHDEEAGQPPKKKVRVNDISANETTTSTVPNDIVAELQKLVKLYDVVPDVSKMDRFQDGILKYILAGEDTKNVLTNIVVLSSHKYLSCAFDRILQDPRCFDARRYLTNTLDNFKLFESTIYHAEQLSKKTVGGMDTNICGILEEINSLGAIEKAILRDTMAAELKISDLSIYDTLSS